jgi:hypothetical protein
MKRHLVLLGSALLLVALTASATWVIASRHAEAKYRTESPSVVEGSVGPYQGGPIRQLREGGHRPDGQTLLRSTNTRTPPGITASGQDAELHRLAELASASGDFAPLGDFLEGVSQSERFRYFDRIPTIFSKWGPSHDIREKMSLLDKLNAPASTLAALRNSILRMEARERYSEMKEEGFLKTLSDDEFAEVCRAIATSRINRAFTSVEDAPSESAKRAAAAAVAKRAIAGGTMEASREIAKLPPGLVRDEAVAELVLFLRLTGSGSEAAPWIETIQDEEARERIGPP